MRKVIYFMNSTRIVALALFAVFAIGPRDSRAVDSRRAGSQAQDAPAWMDAAQNYNNPATGLQGTIGPVGRNRLSLPSQTAELDTGWNSAPAYDPLRNTWNNGANNPSDLQQPTPLQQWRLGIYPQNTDTGVLITEVVPGSAAERAGLEVNDRIISIHGYQVGYVDGTLYDSGQEFERHADAQGWVRLLVQNNRDGKLLNLPVQLAPRNQAIRGTVNYRDRGPLPLDAVMTVELREIYQAGRPPITVARQTFAPGRQLPIPFQLEYDPTQVDTRRQYVLHANISSGGRQLYTLRQDTPVLGNQAASNLQLLLDSTSSIAGGNANPNDGLAQITEWFRNYLGREPRAQERYVWEAHLARGGSLADAQLQILSTPEFYYQANANDAVYVERMFQLVANRQPSSQEISQWLQRLQYHNRIRPEMAREFLAMANQQSRR